MSFKIMGSGIGFKGGRYIAKTRSVAASRAASQLFKRASKDSKHSKKNTIKFILRETTKDSKKKTVAYEATRSTLQTPKVVNIEGKDVVYKYEFSIKKLVNVQDDDDMYADSM
jgi:hypothetical protein